MILIFSTKKIVWGKWTILGPKVTHPHNSTSAVNFFFFKFCRMKGADRYMKFYYFFRKKFIWRNLIFLGHFLLFDWAWLKFSQATVTIGSLVRT